MSKGIIPEKIKVGQVYKFVNDDNEISETSSPYKVEEIFIKKGKEVKVVLRQLDEPRIRSDTIFDYEELCDQIFEGKEMKMVEEYSE
ncbi:MAG: hypothetical protein ACOCP8_08890 [archaeon]